MTTAFHLVIGAGATGAATAKRLADAGANVRIVTRSGSGPDHPGIERVAANAADKATLLRLATGAEVIYNCANPQYHQWASDWPPLAASILNAAEQTGAVLVTLSNLYGYAEPTSPMTAHDPLNPPSRKGQIRTDMWHAALASHQAGRARIVEARASDFIGPDLGSTSHMGDRVVPRIIKGKSVSLLGDIDAAHSWTAIDDVARTLIMLGQQPASWGRAWLVPTVAPLSQRQLVTAFCDAAGVEPVKVSSIPGFAVWAGGVFSPAMRELREVAYQFEAPFVMDSSETTAQFDLHPTPLIETLQATLASYGHRHESDLRVLS
jgi:nucleoside-diphosphate-sugar epimerase